jgi:hypothetical protein
MTAPDLSRVDPDAVLAAVQADDQLGFCVHCGAEAGGVEPDAEGYKCYACGQLAVYGAEQLLLLLDAEGGF